MEDSIGDDWPFGPQSLEPPLSLCWCIGQRPSLQQSIASGEGDSASASAGVVAISNATSATAARILREMSVQLMRSYIISILAK